MSWGSVIFNQPSSKQIIEEDLFTINLRINGQCDNINPLSSLSMFGVRKGSTLKFSKRLTSGTKPKANSTSVSRPSPLPLLSLHSPQCFCDSVRIPSPLLYGRKLQASSLAILAHLSIYYIYIFLFHLELVSFSSSYFYFSRC